MPQVARIGNVEIWIYFHDTDRHKMPHFHAVSPDEQALLSLPGLKVIAGRMRARPLRRVIEWAGENGPLLIETWNRCNPQQPIVVKRAK